LALENEDFSIKKLEYPVFLNIGLEFVMPEGNLRRGKVKRRREGGRGNLGEKGLNGIS